jgi:hypothetical protein
MNQRLSRQDDVTLMLHDPDGNPWPLSLSRDCLKFIGRYPRVAEFDIDALLLFNAGRPAR